MKPIYFWREGFGMVAHFKINFEDIMFMQNDVLISSRIQKRRKLLIGLTGFVGFLFGQH